jgi:glycosyltransferase involved in cell wall biosynthesis
MKSTKLKVAMAAPPWLSIPPKGYGGIEYVVHYLSVELRKLGVEVELFSVGDTTTPVDKLHWYYSDGQYRHIHKTLYDAITLPITQVLYTLKKIKGDGFDIIHDHNGFLGPAAMAYLDHNLFPPVLHTMHGPFSNDQMVANGMPDNRPMYSQFDSIERVFFNGISEAQLNDAPEELRPRIVGAVHNAINVEERTFYKEKDDYFINCGRIARDKGIALGAKLCGELDFKFKIAGLVAGIDNPRRLLLELANANSPYHSNEDFVYYRDKVLPELIPGQIEYIGAIYGDAKDRWLGKAKGYLFPIDWEEPFGVAVLDALVCGTPVIAMRRGALPEIIEHGVNGFLADSEEEFKHYMQRVDEIDPEACRRSVEQKFSAPVMAKKYLGFYQEIISKSRPRN